MLMQMICGLARLVASNYNGFHLLISGKQFLKASCLQIYPARQYRHRLIFKLIENSKVQIHALSCALRFFSLPPSPWILSHHVWNETHRLCRVRARGGGRRFHCRSALALRIPTGFHHSAEGWPAARNYPRVSAKIIPNPLPNVADCIGNAGLNDAIPLGYS